MDEPVTEMRDQIEEMERAYEFLISFAGQGVGREAVQSSTDQIREFVNGFEETLGGAYDAALAVPDSHDEFDTDAYTTFLEEMGRRSRRLGPSSDCWANRTASPPSRSTT